MIAGGFVVGSILVRRWIIWMCAEGIFLFGVHGAGGDDHETCMEMMIIWVLCFTFF